jgi:hypothetical protein
LSRKGKEIRYLGPSPECHKGEAKEVIMYLCPSVGLRKTHSKMPIVSGTHAP